MNANLLNVILLGIAFHLLFFSFQTSVFIQQTVVNSFRTRPDSNFTGDGYVSLCITYAVFALANWLAPSVIAITGVKYGMFFGAITYVLYSFSFIYLTTTLFYLAAGLIGLGAGLLWTAQGSFLSKISDADTSTRNAAIFWSMLQSSILFGNVFVYFAFDNQTTISDKTRYIVYGVLTTVGASGTLFLLLLRGDKEFDDDNTSDNNHIAQSSPSQDGGGGRGAESTCNNTDSMTPWGQFMESLKLAKSRDMILLSTAFLFTGQLLSFFTGVYGTAIGATSEFGIDSKKYIGLAGISIGVGEILGGATFGLLGTRVNRFMGRDAIFILGYAATTIAFTLTALNLPPDSPLVAHSVLPAIIDSRLWIAILSSVLIGLGDACFNTQIYSLLMSVYSDKSACAFALFKFVQSAGSAAAFLYSTRLNLYYQLAILAVISSIATICFCIIEWSKRKRDAIEKTDSQQNIIKHGNDDND
uniref:UNC93-like protein MFSD11 n=1 Tax=Aceria tosichella TaxID=561515 RepID=A0A6G1SDH1_9ACAR